MKFLGIIPARYASTRFPGKPLVEIGGMLMIERVYNQVKKALDDVWVATDDDRIFKAVEAFGGKVVMTSENHKSGTDRCLEASKIIGGDFQVIINIQGDEPFIQPDQIELLKSCFIENESIDIATLIKPFNQEDGIEALFNTNSPKVVVNLKGEAMYFSRSVIPHIRNFEEKEWLKHNTFFKHIGIYAYKSEVLEKIAKLPQSPLEIKESLEQLRWLENGFKIKTAITDI